MSARDRKGSNRALSGLLSVLALSVVGIVFNVVGAQISLALELPIFLDSLGTILAAMLGGYIPGILVGYLTNFFTSISDNTAFFYGIVNVFIAIIAAFLARRGWFKKLPLTLLAILILAVVSGLLSTVITHFLNGVGFYDEATTSMASQLIATGAFDALGAQLFSELFINFVDKTLVVLFATLIYHLIPDEYLAKLDFSPWRQAPLSASELEKTLSARPRGVSLKTKVVALVAVIMTFVAVATTAFSYVTYHQSMIESEAIKAEGITELMGKAVDPDRISEFLEQGEAAPGYIETEKQLARIRDAYEEVQYVYVYQIKEDGCHVVFDPDTAEEEGSDPGDVVAFDQSFMEYVPTLLEGGNIEPVISDETYGWLFTVYTPLKDSTGNTACYLAVDISMSNLLYNEILFILGTITLFTAFLIVVCAIVLWLAQYSIVVPVNSIARASGSFSIDDAHTRTDSVDHIDELDISTGDEIENLYKAVNRMSHDATHYVADAQEKSETISRMQSNLIMVMADLVESRDKFTGDHVRNTALYTRIIMNEMRREGIHPETLTNEFISNVYKSAPLHDVGKIVVSDVILNKEGPLTDEEFEVMKGHALAGKEILEGAKGAVSESSYLDEAQNLAAHHHEKWDGTGYPSGLSGEDIPLSARIMAVADVFDALVSKRSYKEAFPIEKAFAIIEEGIGTHFDPDVARAFLNAKDKVRAVAEQSDEKR